MQESACHSQQGRLKLALSSAAVIQTTQDLREERQGSVGGLGNTIRGQVPPPASPRAPPNAPLSIAVVHEQCGKPATALSLSNRCCTPARPETTPVGLRGLPSPSGFPPSAAGTKQRHLGPGPAFHWDCAFAVLQVQNLAEQRSGAEVGCSLW